MAPDLPRAWRRAARRFTLYVAVAAVACAILTPLLMLLNLSLLSDYEAYDAWPTPLAPARAPVFRLRRTAHEAGAAAYAVDIRHPVSGAWDPLGRYADLEAMADFLARKTNCRTDAAALREQARRLAREGGPVEFALPKSLGRNYATFFRVTEGARAALFRSISVALTTILISLGIGSLAGYAFARYVFRGRRALQVSVLFVRMFPGVAIAIPMVVVLGRLGLYDNPLGLSLLYAVGQIGLTVWITASIFLSIPPELEEAAQVFGTSRAGAVWHVTLPLAMPGLAACALYGFIMSWNETIQAIVLTQSNPTFSVVVYQSLVGATGMANLTAAGGVVMALPSVIFTFIIRRYVLQMWGGAGQ